MKASSIVRGYLQTKIVRLPLAGMPTTTIFASADGPDPGAERAPDPAPAPVEIGLRALTAGEEADIYARAASYARSHGLEKPAEGDELYEYGKALHRCLLGVVDAEAIGGRGEPFFDGGLAQIESMPELGKDGVLTLAEQHQTFQDEVSGLVANMGEDGLQAAIRELAGPRGGPFFFALRPGLRASLALSMAKLLWTLLEDKSSSGSDSELTGKPTPRSEASSTGEP